MKSKFDKIVQYIILLSLLIATIGSFYIFVLTLVFKDKSYSGFFNSWQFPMLLAIFIDASYYEHINSLI